MKKTNKALAVILSIVMLFSCCGLVFANAATVEEATVAADEWNAAKRDHSDVYSTYLTEASVQGIINRLDPMLKKALANNVIENILYTDSVATEIIRFLVFLIPEEGVPLFGTLRLNRPVPNGIINESFEQVALDRYPEAWDYLQAAGEDWNAVKVIPFGINDKASFVDAVSVGCTGFSNILKIVLGWCNWEECLGGLLDSLHVGKMIDWKTYNGSYKTTQDAATNNFMLPTSEGGYGLNSTQIGNYYSIEPILQQIVKVVDAVKEAPLTYLLDVLPDLATNFDEFAANTDRYCEASLMGAPLGIPSLAEVVYPIFTNMGLTLPETDLIDEIKDMGTAKAAENCSAAENGYGIMINGDKPMVLTAIINYVAELVKIEGNIEALGKVIVGDNLSADTYYGLVNALKADNIDLAVGYVFQAVQEYAQKQVEAEKENSDSVLGWFYKLIEIITNFVKKILGVK